MDYTAWIFRASQFLRSLAWLPGDIEINDGIEEPASDQHSLDWLGSPKCSVPQELRAFMQSASRRCYLHYRWKPPESLQARIADIWPGHPELNGGGDLCELARHLVYDHRDWFKSVLGRRSQGGASDPARERGLIPILILQGDARLSLDMNAPSEHPPVVYTPPNDFATPHLISPSFDQFLMDWERLCYIQPDPDTLAPWLSADGRGLNTECEATARLNTLFKSSASPIQDAANGTSDSLAGWFRRVEHFVRHLHRLPGQWGISVSVEPPVKLASEDDVHRAAALPPPLVKLYTEGSARCRCRYHWEPASEDLPRIGELIPHQYSFYGGAEFIPWDELPLTPGVDWGWFDEENHTEEERRADAVWKQTLPFIHVRNGDVVGLQMSDTPDSMPVVYLSHEEPTEVTVLSGSLEQFLADSERLAYIGPEIWLLSHFLDEAHGGLPRINHQKAERWREILEGNT